MPGWEIFVTRQSDAGADGRTAETPSLASWRAGVGGTKWLDDLVSKGVATDLGGDGYPYRYSVPAGVLMAVLPHGSPHDVGSLVRGDGYDLSSWQAANAVIDIALMRSIDPSEILAVEAWDQS